VIAPIWHRDIYSR